MFRTTVRRWVKPVNEQTGARASEIKNTIGLSRVAKNGAEEERGSWAEEHSGLH